MSETKDVFLEGELKPGLTVGRSLPYPPVTWRRRVDGDPPDALDELRATFAKKGRSIWHFRRPKTRHGGRRERAMAAAQHDQEPRP